MLASQIDTLEDGLKYHNYENVGTRIAGVSAIGTEQSNLDSVSKWRRSGTNRNNNAATLLTTTSKFVSWVILFKWFSKK